MTGPAKLTPDDQLTLDAIRRRGSAFDTLTGHVRDFADMMHKRRGARPP
jgi:hypothetical protein